MFFWCKKSQLQNIWMNSCHRFSFSFYSTKSIKFVQLPFFYKQTHSEKQDTVSQSNGARVMKRPWYRQTTKLTLLSFCLMNELWRLGLWGLPQQLKILELFNYEILLFCLQVGSVVWVIDQWGVRGKVDFLAGMENFSPAAQDDWNQWRGRSQAPPPHTYTAMHS